METALNEITLVLFTTIAPAGVVGYLVMATVIIRCRDDARASAIGHYLVIPLVLTITGLIVSATHLGTPANALYVLTGVGRSPLSNEVVAAVAFLALGGIYWIVSFRDDAKHAFRIAWLGVTVVAGLAFVGFIGVAYSVPSVPTWNLPMTPITLWLNAFSSGPLVGLLGLALARQEASRQKTVGLLAVVACAAGANTIMLAWEWQALEGIVTTTTRAVDLVPLLPVILAAFLALEALAIALSGVALLARRLPSTGDPFARAQRTRTMRLTLLIVGVAVALTASFVVRFAFYAMHMTVGV